MKNLFHIYIYYYFTILGCVASRNTFFLYLYLFLKLVAQVLSLFIFHILLSNCAKWVLCIYNCIFNMFYVISTLFMCANIQIVKCLYRSGNLIFKVQLYFKYL